MSTQFLLSTDRCSVELQINDSNFTNLLKQYCPIESRTSTWGSEIYFPIPVKHEPSSTTKDVQSGDVAYWPQGTSLAIFFGPTPMSDGKKPVPADEVLVIGELDDQVDKLENIKAGDTIEITTP